MSTKKLTACPKCNSEMGYRFNILYEMEGDWGSEPQSTERDIAPTTVKCCECGHRVSRKGAEGRDDEK